MKVLLVGPFDANGRYEGGIAFFVNSIFSEKSLNYSKNLYIKKFDTCRIARKITGQGRISIENIKNTLCIIKALKKNAKISNADVIYYNSSYGISLLKDLLAIKISHCKKYSKIVLHIHFADADKLLHSNRILSKITLKLMKNAVDHVVFLSKETRKSFINKGLDKEKTSVIYNFYNIYMSEDEVRWKISNLNKKSKREMVFIGSIDERKGIIDLLEALKKVDTQYHLLICGKSVDESIEKKVHLLMNNLPSGAVDLRGFVSGKEKENILKQSDIILLPSYGEGFPIALLEGIGTANAVITTDVGAIPEVFDAKNGYIVKPGNIDGIASAIDNLGTERLSDVMKTNYEMSKRFNIESFIEQMTSVCKKVLK